MCAIFDDSSISIMTYARATIDPNEALRHIAFVSNDDNE